MRDRSTPDRFLDLSYEAIEHSPLETIERVYEFLGWPLTRAASDAMTAFIAANPKNKHGVHRYSLAEYGLDAHTELKRFQRYCERFAIPVRAER